MTGQRDKYEGGGTTEWGLSHSLFLRPLRRDTKSFYNLTCSKEPLKTFPTLSQINRHTFDKIIPHIILLVKLEIIKDKWCF